MKDFFKPEDFYSAIQYSVGAEECKKKIAITANGKLNAMIESWPVVYASPFIATQPKNWYTHPHPTLDTHKARIAFVERIVKEPCKHENILTYVTSLAEGPAVAVVLKDKFKCNDCYVELTPTWSIKDGK